VCSAFADALFGEAGISTTLALIRNELATQRR